MSQTCSAVRPPADSVAQEYTAEIRFGVVMYGGVSVAIYMVLVEPSPEQLDPHRLPDPQHPPDALRKSLAARTSIPRYETSAGLCDWLAKLQ